MRGRSRWWLVDPTEIVGSGMSPDPGSETIRKW